MRILYLPLDSRPCNYLWPQRLLSGTPHEVIAPPEEIMDYFRRPADTEGLRAFIREQLPRADAAAVSAEMLLYGGILASRTPDTALETALDRLEILKEIARRVPVHVFGLIMRSSVSAFCQDDLKAYHLMTEYSVSWGQAWQAGGDTSAVDRKYEALLPENVLSAYRRVRQRNHAVNLKLLEMRREGALSSLMLLQEDAQEHGFHRREQAELTEYINANRLTDVFLHNGADEGGVMACLKAIGPSPLPVDVSFTRGDGSFVARYEDRPFRENLSSCMRYLNLTSGGGAPTRLVIHTPLGEQGEAAWQSPLPAPDLDALEKQFSVPCYLLDVEFANGGSLYLMSRLRDKGLISSLSGYSGWNTSVNSMGTMLALIRADALRGRPSPAFKWERLLDDLLYESIIRQKAAGILAGQGEDVYSLKDKPAAQALINSLLAEELKSGWGEAMQKEGFSRAGYLLPWDRLFECDVKLD